MTNKKRSRAFVLKKEEMKRNNTLLLLLAAVIVITGGFLINNKGIDLSNVSLSNIQLPSRNENMEMYINNEYRFKVAIPTNKLVQENANSFWIYTDDGNYLKLSISVRTEHERALYEDIFALSNGETYEKYTASTFKKLLSKNYLDYKFVTTWSKTAPDQEIEHSVAYSAVWLHKSKPPIELVLFTEPFYESYLVQNKDIFDDLVKSFQFF